MDHDDERRAAAIDRINQTREFRSHAVIYLAVNALLVVIWAASGGGYFWPIWVIGGWGIGLAAHAWRVFGETPISEADIVREMQRSDTLSDPSAPSADADDAADGRTPRAS